LPKRVPTSHTDPEDPTREPSHEPQESEPMPEQEAVVADLKALETELERMASERETLHSQLLRTMADMQNYKRRVEQEREQTRQRASEALLSELLPALDSFERTLQAAEGGASREALLEGVKGVHRQLWTSLERRKLERIPSVGAAFDPNLHDAIMIAPDAQEPEGTILEEFESGYTLNGQVLRPARVKVAKGV
jgi:molecular chaperone GrpE